MPEKSDYRHLLTHALIDITEDHVLLHRDSRGSNFRSTVFKMSRCFAQAPAVLDLAVE